MKHDHFNWTLLGEAVADLALFMSSVYLLVAFFDLMSYGQTLVGWAAIVGCGLIVLSAFLYLRIISQSSRSKSPRRESKTRNDD